MQVFSKSLNLVILPVPCQAATVCKYQTPSPVHHVILPISGKHWTIFLVLSAPPNPLVIAWLPYVDSPTIAKE